MELAWVHLFLAGLLEIAWALGMKLSHGFTRLGWTLFTAAAMVLSFAFLLLAIRQLPLGTAYAVWTGIGAAGTALVGIFFLGEPSDLARLLCIAAIVAGVAGLKLTSG